MKKFFSLIVAALFVLSHAGMSFADSQVLVTNGSTDKPSLKKERLTSETATVTAVNLTTRLVTLKGPKGKIFDITASEEVRNLDQVKVGDKVKVKYYESVAIEVVASGQAPGGAQAAVALDRAKLGEKPAGMIRGQLTVTAKVVAIGKKKQSVTLKGPEGKTYQVKVENLENLKNVTVGDEVVITASEALAITVESLK